MKQLPGMHRNRPFRTPLFLLALLLIVVALPADAGPVFWVSGGRAWPTFQDDVWDFREAGRAFSAGAGFFARDRLIVYPAVEWHDFDGGRVPESIGITEDHAEEHVESANTRLVTAEALLKYIAIPQIGRRGSAYLVGGVGWFRVEMGELIQVTEDERYPIWRGDSQQGLTYTFGVGVEYPVGKQVSVGLELRHHTIMTDENLDRYRLASQYETMRHLALRLGLWFYL